MKKFSIFIFIFITLSMLSYYFIDESYKLSFEAKFYYEMNDYDKAEKLAKIAYEKNRYNNMAFTILTQSKIAKIWQEYIQNSNQYLFDIDSIANKDRITKKDKMRVKLMLEIIIGEYKNLPKSKLLNKELKLKATQNYKKAVELYNGIFKS